MLEGKCQPLVTPVGFGVYSTHHLQAGNEYPSAIAANMFFVYIYPKYSAQEVPVHLLEAAPHDSLVWPSDTAYPCMAVSLPS